MDGIQGFLAISRHSIGAGKISTVSSRDDAVITLWVEKGSVDLIEDVNRPKRVLARIEARCSVPLPPGKVHLRNAGKSPALVFVAMAQAADPPPPVHRVKKNMPDAAAPPDGVAETLDGAAGPPETDQYAVWCTCGQFSETGLDYEKAIALKKEHKKLGCVGRLEGPTRCA